MVLKEPVSLQDTSDKLIIASSEQFFFEDRDEKQDESNRNLYDVIRDTNDIGVVVTGIVVERL